MWDRIVDGIFSALGERVVLILSTAATSVFYWWTGHRRRRWHPNANPSDGPTFPPPPLHGTRRAFLVTGFFLFALVTFSVLLACWDWRQLAHARQLARQGDFHGALIQSDQPHFFFEPDTATINEWRQEWLERIERLARQGDLELARAELQRAAEKMPGDPSLSAMDRAVESHAKVIAAVRASEDGAHLDAAQLAKAAIASAANRSEVLSELEPVSERTVREVERLAKDDQYEQAADLVRAAGPLLTEHDQRLGDFRAKLVDRQLAEAREYVLRTRYDLAAVAIANVLDVNPGLTSAQQLKIQIDGKLFVTYRLSSAGVEMVMRYVPPGMVMVGHDSAPTAVAHQVTLTRGFYIATTEVTQQQWAAVLPGVVDPSQVRHPRNPVDSVTYAQAHDFARQVSMVTGVRMRLPTEAEWEHACRLGAAVLTAKQNVDAPEPVPVGSFGVDAIGLADMIGNVAEWCSDWWAPYPAVGVTDPSGPARGEKRVVRGGSFLDRPEWCAPWYRAPRPPTNRDRATGFRLVADLPR